MRIRVALLVLSVGMLRAQPGVPAFTADRVLPSGGDRPARLQPGILVSIYGTDLGPERACTGNADAHPNDLCGVQVIFGETQAGLLYVQQNQINFQVPKDAPMEGMAPLRVVYQGRSSSAVAMRLGMLWLEEPAHVGGPVWLHIGRNGIQYPVGVQPADFGCHRIEVRRDGNLLPRISLRPGADFFAGNAGNGLMCGNIGIPGHPVIRKNRLPLHLQYRFDKPGVYEVRYTYQRSFDARQAFQTPWTPIEIQPPQPEPPRAPPQDPAEAISDYLPSILGYPDDAHLRLVTGYLYHSDHTVRQYTALSLAYWPEEEINRRLAELLRTRGPSDVIAERTFRSPEALEFILPHLQSKDPVLLEGAVIGVTRLLFSDPPLLSIHARARAEDALVSASENVQRVADEQALHAYAVALGSVHDSRARDLLWGFVDRNILTEQSLIAITWLKNLADLPRFAGLLEAPAKGDPKRYTYASLPYAIHRAYGDAALPVLESAIQKSGYDFVRTNCARELVLANSKSGFAFIAQAIEQNKFYRAEMVRFVKERFPELQSANDSEILSFLRAR